MDAVSIVEPLLSYGVRIDEVGVLSHQDSPIQLATLEGNRQSQHG